MFFVKHGLKICDKRYILKVFDINQDGRKSIMAQNDEPRNPMKRPKESNDILDEWVKIYKHECMSIFDVLVALELMS
jgi:hypothetical protein